MAGQRSGKGFERVSKTNESGRRAQRPREGPGQASEALPPVVLVTGPTAGGKSRLALDLAEEFGGSVINADALQVYRELEILTARPGAETLARAPHRLYGVLPAAEVCSAGRWQALALAEIAAAREAGRLPIVAGGTGLYLQALELGLSAIPDIPEEIRAATRRQYRELGGTAFHAALAERDPDAGSRLRPSDSQRLMRAWEVLEATGRSLFDWQRDSPMPPPYRFLRLALMPPREALYAACDRRFLEMLEAGALAEVERLLALGLDPGLPAMKAVGVAELGAHLVGEIPLEQAVARAQQATRRYAKRQYTWLRGQGAGARVFGAQYSESLKAEIFNIICDFLLTPSG